MEPAGGKIFNGHIALPSTCEELPDCEARALPVRLAA